MERITLTTDDGVTIVGTLYPAGQQDAPAVLLLHMMPATKESWAHFAPLLQKRGFQVLAIDERGHGESTQQGDAVLNYREFSDEEQQAKMLDVVAAKTFFTERGVSPEQFFVAGASIGANLAIQYLVHNPEAKAGFALSPGYNYMGIEILPLVEQLTPKQALYMAAAQDDSGVPDSYKAVEGTATAARAHIKHTIFAHGGHGTDIFAEHPEFMEELAEWLSQFIK
jgi:alpha-beta hydrolase superfamily lysophospholipase